VRARPDTRQVAVIDRGEDGPGSNDGLLSPAPQAHWIMDEAGIRLCDGSANNYGAPSGKGVTVEIGPDGRAFFCGDLRGNLPGRMAGAIRIACVWLVGAVIGAVAIGWALETHLHPGSRAASPIVFYVQGTPAPAVATRPSSTSSEAPQPPVARARGLRPQVDASPYPVAAGRSSSGPPAPTVWVLTPAPVHAPSHTPAPVPSPSPSPSASTSPSPHPSTTPTPSPSSSSSPSPAQSKH
jgi:hypothetical protein